MALLALLGISAFGVVSFVVGLRLVLLSRRTGLLPERLIGVSLFLAGGLGTALLVAASFAGEARWLVATISVLMINLGVVALGVFNWRVFRPTLFGATLVAACIALLFLSMIVDRLAGEYLGASRGVFSITVDYAGRLILYGWATYESLRQYALARRRVRIGLTEPLVANRFLLWGIGTSAALGIWLHAFVEGAPAALRPHGELPRDHRARQRLRAGDLVGVLSAARVPRVVRRPVVRSQRPLNAGRRFSRIAASASRWSSLWKVTISSAVEESKATLAASFTNLLTASFV